MVCITAIRALVVALVCVFCYPSVFASGHGFSNGDRWVYDIETIIGGTPVWGELVYSYLGSQQPYWDDSDEPMDVFKITGFFEGSSFVAGVETSVSGVYDGYGYTVQGGIATIRNDIATFANMTHSNGTLSLATIFDIHEEVTYTPPLMSGFDGDSASLGDTWNETVEKQLISSFDDGSVSYNEDTFFEELYEFSVDSVNEPIETDAGEFSCIIVNMSYESGNEVIWYCPAVGRPVRIERYCSEDYESCFVAELSEYSFGGDGIALMVLIVGLGVGVIILVLVAFMAPKRSSGAIPPEEQDAKNEESDDEEAGEELKPG
ncbi:MAG: hypothetical protein JSV94_00060 [Methanobacteriota archaeon]|nr:MAG: hypothetical protein JSV94_00060 [Euryarchaeota archaeon]